MKLDSACRALLSGATLLATTAMAAPSPAQPQPPASHCLGQPSSSHAAQRPAPHRWHNPCHLADAEKPASQQENDADAPPKDVRQRLAEIEMLSSLNPPADELQPLTWLAAGERNDNDGMQWQSQGGPGSWTQHGLPMYQRDGVHAKVESAIPAVPEPASATLLLAGLAIVAGAVIRQQRRS